MAIKKIRSIFTISSVDVLIYVSTKKTLEYDCAINHPIVHNVHGKRESYVVTDLGKIVHKSFLYRDVQIIKLIERSGLVIGSCYTNETYRGQSIYPKVLSYIAKDNMASGDDMLMVVDSDNVPSIRGIEKAGFVKLAHIKAKKWTMFYFNKNITRVAL